MEVQVPVQELVDQELPLAREQELEQALAQALAQGQDPELLRVLELVVQALEQVVRVLLFFVGLKIILQQMVPQAVL